jgi:hypothetical protein
VSVADAGGRLAPARPGASTPLLTPLLIEKLAPEVGGAAPAGAKKTSAKKTATKPKTAAAGYASTAAAKKGDPLAFLRDPGLSVETKLMRLMAHLNAQYEAKMEEKLRTLGGNEDAAATKTGSTKPSSSGSSKPKKNGFLSAVAAGVKKFFPAVGIAASVLKTKSVQTLLGKIGGPVLAAAASAMGFPALAPALLKLGPSIVNVAVDAAKAIDAAGTPAGSKGAATLSSASSSGSSAASTTSASSKKELSDSDKQLAYLEIQRLQDAQKNMFQLVSNILKSGHDTRSGIIGNIR